MKKHNFGPITDYDEGDIVENDPLFQQINEKLLEIIELVKSDDNYSMICHFGKEESEDSVAVYSAIYGKSTTVIESMYVDLKKMISEGKYDLFEDLFEMMCELHLIKNALEQDQENSLKNFETSNTLH